MPKKTERDVSFLRPPTAADFDCDLERARQSVVALKADVPEDAFTAGTLGIERAGSGVVIGDRGLVLTIGYLVTEAESLWLTTYDNRAVPGHVLGYDQETGFGLVQALGKLDVPPLPLGDSSETKIGDPVLIAGGGRAQSVFARIVAKQEFAGYWEYLLDEAIFTAPAHGFWGGTGMIGRDGKLLGIGSLHVQQATGLGSARDVNMIVPIDLLKPILDDLMKFGRVNKPSRPWLGLYAAENEGKLVVIGLAERGPAASAGLRQGDVISGVRDAEVETLPDLFRQIWASGPAGAEIPIEVKRDGRTMWVRVRSSDRTKHLKGPRLQ
ncbi:MAG: S1C family serine protease [Alphaproteobacteria bacterium]